MSDFTDTVNALNPILFWPVYELTGTTLADISGEGNDGTLSSGVVSLGHAGMIETDPDSRSIHVTDNLSNFGAEIPDPLPAELQYVGNVTVIAFAADEGGASGQRFLFSRGGVAGTNQGGHILYTSGSSSSRTMHGAVELDDGFNTIYDVGNELAVFVNGQSYMISLVRNGANLRLYQNDELAGESNDLSLDALRFESNKHLKYGGSGNNLAPWGGYLGPLIIFDYALTAAQIAEIYQSAINSLFLNGRADAFDTGILYSAFEPDPITAGFRHNWDELVVERLTWLTGIGQGRTGPEEAAGAAMTPPEGGRIYPPLQKRLRAP